MREIFVQGSIPEFEHDGDDLDRLYLPSRAVCFGINRPDRLIVLPGSDGIVRYSHELNEIIAELDLQKPRTLEIPDSEYFLDIGLFQNLTAFTQVLNNEDEYTVWPYARTPNLDLWLNALREQGYNIRTHLPKRVYFDDLTNPQHRGGWGRWVRDPDEPTFAEINNIPYPVSYIGVGVEELTQAYERVIKISGSRSVFFKPIFSAGGFSLREISSSNELRDAYTELFNSGALELFGQETPVEIQQKIEGIKMLVSFQYTAGEIVTPGGLSVQTVEGKNWTGNLFNNGKEVVNNIKPNDIFEKYKAGINKKYAKTVNSMGGFDGAVYEEEGELKFTVIELNADRVTGAHPGIALAQGLGVSERPFLIRKTGDPNCDLKTLWEMMKKEGISFDMAAKRGVFPFVWVAGSGFLFTVGNDTKDILELTDRALNLTKVNGYINE